MESLTDSEVSRASSDRQTARTRSLSSSQTLNSSATLSPRKDETPLTDQDTSRPPSRASIGPGGLPRSHLQTHTRQRSVGAGAAIRRRLSATLELLSVGQGGYSSDPDLLGGRVNDGGGSVVAGSPLQKMTKADVEAYMEGMLDQRSQSSSNLLATLPDTKEENVIQSVQKGSTFPGRPKAERRRATTSEGTPSTFGKVKDATPSVSSKASSSSSQRFSTFFNERFLNNSSTKSASTSTITTRKSLSHVDQEQSADLPRSTSSPDSSSLSSLSIHDLSSSIHANGIARRSIANRRTDSPGGDPNTSRRAALSWSRQQRTGPSSRPSEDNITHLPTKDLVEKPVYPHVAPAAMEVSEFAKWGGPVSDMCIVGFANGPGCGDQRLGRANHLVTAAMREAFFEPPSDSQRTMVAIDGTTDSALCAAGIGCDPGHCRGKKRVRKEIGERVIEAVKNENGSMMGGVIVELPYAVGFEREVMDLEGMLHESYREVAGGKLTFYPPTEPPPVKVLDIGTGMGLWPIAMAQEWPDSTFVGFDLVPVQVDLASLAMRQVSRRAKMKIVFPTSDAEASVSSPEAEINYIDINNRVQWELGNFLQPLPFDSGTFDLVHMRFCGLGVPEAKWPDLLEEATRVLKRGTGVLEIVETTYGLPLSAPMSRRFSHETLLRAAFINPLPFTQIRPALAMSGLQARQVFQETFHRRPMEEEAFDASFVFARATDVWADSALEKSARAKAMTNGQGDAFVEMAMRNDHDMRRDETTTTGDEVVLTAWICKKR